MASVSDIDTAEAQTPRELADAEHQASAAAAIVAVLRGDEGTALRIVAGMWPYRANELARAAGRLAEMAEERE